MTRVTVRRHPTGALHRQQTVTSNSDRLRNNLKIFRMDKNNIRIYKIWEQ